MRVRRQDQNPSPDCDGLVQKVKDLGTTIDTVQQMFKKFVDRTKNIISKTKKRIMASPGMRSAFNPASVGDFFNKIVSVRVNNENFDTTTTWEQISQTAKANAPGYYGGKTPVPGSPITQDMVSEDLNSIRRRDEAKNLDMIYMSEYDMKYRLTTGLGLDKLLVNLEDLQKTITDTYAPMDKIKVCTGNIVGKQCGG